MIRTTFFRGTTSVDLSATPIHTTVVLFARQVGPRIDLACCPSHPPHSYLPHIVCSTPQIHRTHVGGGTSIGIILHPLVVARPRSSSASLDAPRIFSAPGFPYHPLHPLHPLHLLYSHVHFDDTLLLPLPLFHDCERHTRPLLCSCPTSRTFTSLEGGHTYACGDRPVRWCG